MILQKTERINKNRLDSLQNYYNLDDNTKEMLNKYLSVESDYRYALREMSAKLENLDDYCQANFDHNPIHHIESRIKTLDSILEKMERRGLEKNFDNLKKYIYDIAGIRVICNYINDIYQIINLLKKQKDLKIYLEKDYLVNPKESGYRSFHVVFYIEIYKENEAVEVPVEIQFRTIAMDMWATLEHELRYKSKNHLSEEDKRTLRQASDDIYNIDLKMQRVYIHMKCGDDDDD